MKILKSLIMALALIVLALTTLTSRAADYAVQKTFLSTPGIAWATGNGSNVNTMIDLTVSDTFTLEVFTVFSTAPSGATSCALVWQQSADGSNFNTTTNDQIAGVKGWFSYLSSTGGGFTNYFITNITVGTPGYYRVAAFTNSAGQNITNIAIKGYVKPKRTNRDY